MHRSEQIKKTLYRWEHNARNQFEPPDNRVDAFGYDKYPAVTRTIYYILGDTNNLPGEPQGKKITQLYIRLRRILRRGYGKYHPNRMKPSRNLELCYKK